VELSRRGFFKAAGAALATAASYEMLAASPALAVESSDEWKLVNTEEYTNICCYCSGGCGSLCSVRDGELINLEGDPDHPVNEGALCPKGAAMSQLRNIVDPETREVIKNPNRRTKPLVRRPGASDWEDISWDDAISEIARKVKDTRDETFEEVAADGTVVNRCPGIASLGGSQQNSEEEYLILKIMRSLGVLAIDNQTRVCHSSTVAGLAPTFGRGSMTGHWCDYQNADVIMTIGSNNVENHPVSSKWVQRALDRGATWIVVDPRYTRSAELADIYCPIRSGSDIAFYGGLFNYIIENDLWQHDYVVNYTNASYLLDEEYSFDVNEGLFSGYDESTGKYSAATWHYQVESEQEWDTSSTGAYSWVNKPGTPEFTTPTLQVPKKDPTLEDPMCVWQQFKKHYSRYDMDTVCSICGMDKERLELVYSTYAATGAADKSGTILYALGQTQHSYGGQNCRSMSILQLLLGNAGLAGGGVNAMRGEPNVQGATDMAMTVPDLPGYLKWPTEYETPSLRKWCETQTYSDGYYTNKPKFMVSFLKEWWGDAATVDNDYGYDWLPKIPKSPDFTIISSFELMAQGVIKGYFNWGMNPCHSAPNAGNVRRAMANLDWLVVADWVETESACFWKAPDMNPAEIDTTVYYLPAALIYEKPGLIANSGRWLQYRYKAVEPWDQAKPDYEICDLLWTAIRDLYEKEGGVGVEPILNMKWDYYVDGKIDPRPVAWAFNGYNVANSDFDAEKVDLIKGYSELQADGSTSCAIWIYSGLWNNNDAPLDAAQQPCGSRIREAEGGLGLNSDWSFAWPNNRRILYNRASCDLEGKPWNPDKVLVEWDGSKWIQNDVADFVAAKDGVPVPPNNKAFFMTWEQNARLVSYAMADGPLPEHYEPFESPTVNAMNGRQNSPCILFTEFESTKHGDSTEYPIAASTYSVVEHWQTGGQSRSCPALVEAMPEQFVEMSKELAEEKGIENGDYVRVFNNRGSVEVQALVTSRFKPFTVAGKTVHQVGLTHHFSWANDYATGDTVNDLTPNVGDPTSFIPEYKAFLVDIEKA
jgi:formate dehydrogenase major subunit